MQRTCVLRQGFNIAVSRDRGKASGSGSCQRPSEKWANGTARRPRRVIRVVSVTGFQRPGGVRDGAGVAADRCRGFLHIGETPTKSDE